MKFAAVELELELKTYVVYVGSVSSVASPSSSLLDVHRRPQKASLIAEETPTKVSNEYVDFAFFPNLASKLKIMVLSWSMLTGSSDHPSHPQVLSFFPILFDRKSDRSL